MNNVKLILRMIEHGFNDNEIVMRIRCSPEFVATVREQLRLEQEQKNRKNNE